MDAISDLGSVVGVAFLSGLRLYSTVLAIGLGTRLGYLILPARLDQLRMLAETPVLVIAGICYAFEFVADRVYWIR